MNPQQETTIWSVSTPNHIYIFDGPLKGRAGKAIGYVKAGTDRVQKFSKPMQIDLRNRTFVAVK